MHETIIAADILNEAKKHGKVKKIFVEVGDLGHLPAEEMGETLRQLVDWDVIITKKKGKVKCQCGYEGEPKILEKRHGFTSFVCPKCGNIPEILDGENIILKSLEVEE